MRRVKRAAKLLSHHKRAAATAVAAAAAVTVPDGNHAADGTPLVSPRSVGSLSPTSRARQGSFMASPLLPRRHRIQQQERWENTARVLGLGSVTAGAVEGDEDSAANVYAAIGRLEHGGDATITAAPVHLMATHIGYCQNFLNPYTHAAAGSMCTAVSPGNPFFS